MERSSSRFGLVGDEGKVTEEKTKEQQQRERAYRQRVIWTLVERR